MAPWWLHINLVREVLHSKTWQEFNFYAKHISFIVISCRLLNISLLHFPVSVILCNSYLSGGKTVMNET